MQNESLEERSAYKIKQLNEAISLLDDIGWRVCWALDFSSFESINEELSPVQEAIYEAQENLQEELSELEEATEEHETEKFLINYEFEKESDLARYLD